MEELRNKPVRGDEALEKQPATDQQRAAAEKDPSEVQEETADERERQEELARLTAKYGLVAGCIDKIMGVPPILEIEEALSPELAHGLELLYQARTSTNELGTFTSALQRSRYLNQALAILQPALAIARAPEQSDAIQESYEEIKSEVGALRHDIKQRILLEAGAGKSRRKKKLKESARSELGSLAWELAQLVKKRGKAKLPFDPGGHPVVNALEYLDEVSRELGKLAAELARLDEKRTAGDAAATAAWDESIARVRELLIQLAERCRPEATGIADPGRYPTLAEAFGFLPDRELDGDAAVLRCAREVVTTAATCLDEAEEIVEAESSDAPVEQKRGVLGRLFGRGKKS